MKQFRNALCIAFSTYSKIPMPQVDWSDENRRYAMCFFPLIGAALGLAMMGWLWLCGRLGIGPFLRGAGGAALPLLLTGGIHMDGFMDTRDALASWQSQERRLEILKDSHTGAFAVMGCCLYLLLDAALLSEVTFREGGALLCVFVLSRALSALALTTLRKAKPTGLLAGFAQTAQTRAVILSACGYGLLAALGLFLWRGWAGLLPLAGAGACFFYYRRMAYKQFGGVTGDLAGWFLQVTELCCAALIVLGGRLG